MASKHSDAAKQLGRWAEKTALAHLQAHGYVLIHANFYSPYGEIDLIVQGNQLLLVEVKARRSGCYGHAVEVISRSKQLKIMRTALYFLQQYPQFEQFELRFDAICIDLTQASSCKTTDLLTSSDYQLQWIENAFTFDADFINL